MLVTYFVKYSNEAMVLACSSIMKVWVIWMLNNIFANAKQQTANAEQRLMYKVSVTLRGVLNVWLKTIFLSAY
jgi:hypothetical protein